MTEMKSLSKLKKAGKFHYWCDTIEIPEIELHAICDEIQEEYDRAIAALNKAAGRWAKADALLRELESGLNSDGLPNGLIISDDGNLLNWCGENYVKQSTLEGGTLTPEQVRELIAPHMHAKPTFDFGRHGAVWVTDFQAIADELNAELSGRNCARCAEDMGRYADSLCDPLKKRIAELLCRLENDWHIHASWDGLRKFWCIELTEEGVKLRDVKMEQSEHIEELESLLCDMYENFTQCYVLRSSFRDVCFNDCPHNKSFSCNLRVDYFERMLELGLVEDE